MQIQPVELDGCYCVRGTVLDEDSGNCVPESECQTTTEKMCQDAAGTMRQSGERWDVDRCTWCSCQRQQGDRPPSVVCQQTKCPDPPECPDTHSLVRKDNGEECCPVFECGERKF